MDSTIPRRAFGCLLTLAIMALFLSLPLILRGAPIIQTILLASGVVLVAGALIAAFIFGVCCIIAD